MNLNSSWCITGRIKERDFELVKPTVYEATVIMKPRPLVDIEEGFMIQGKLGYNIHKAVRYFAFNTSDVLRLDQCYVESCLKKDSICLYR